MSTTKSISTPTIPPDAEAGIRWFNSLTRDERSTWLRLAGSAIPADAWTLRNRLRRGPRGSAA